MSIVTTTENNVGSPAHDTRPRCTDCKKPIEGRPWHYCELPMCHDCWKANEEFDADCS